MREVARRVGNPIKGFPLFSSKKETSGSAFHVCAAEPANAAKRQRLRSLRREASKRGVAAKTEMYAPSPKETSGRREAAKTEMYAP